MPSRFLALRSAPARFFGPTGPTGASSPSYGAFGCTSSRCVSSTDVRHRGDRQVGRGGVLKGLVCSGGIVVGLPGTEGVLEGRHVQLPVVALPELPSDSTVEPFDAAIELRTAVWRSGRRDTFGPGVARKPDFVRALSPRRTARDGHVDSHLRHHDVDDDHVQPVAWEIGRTFGTSRRGVSVPSSGAG